METVQGSNDFPMLNEYLSFIDRYVVRDLERIQHQSGGGLGDGRDFGLGEGISFRGLLPAENISAASPS